MPLGDKTGPEGRGPMTGRGFGFCAGYRHQGYMHGVSAGLGRSFGYGRGYGRGYKWGFGAGYTGHYPEDFFPAETEKSFLENEIRYLERRRKDIHKRLDELNQEDKKNES
ncbi:MAG: DUF5320 domain-containing protein [Chlorobi bacterium]|nr:DUF5320 domain-containing protein [Chlorobiota bacterium]